MKNYSSYGNSVELFWYNQDSLEVIYEDYDGNKSLYNTDMRYKLYKPDYYYSPSRYSNKILGISIGDVVNGYCDPLQCNYVSKEGKKSEEAYYNNEQLLLQLRNFDSIKEKYNRERIIINIRDYYSKIETPITKLIDIFDKRCLNDIELYLSLQYFLFFDNTSFLQNYYCILPNGESEKYEVTLFGLKSKYYENSFYPYYFKNIENYEVKYSKLVSVIKRYSPRYHKCFYSYKESKEKAEKKFDSTLDRYNSRFLNSLISNKKYIVDFAKVLKSQFNLTDVDALDLAWCAFNKKIMSFIHNQWVSNCPCGEIGDKTLEDYLKECYDNHVLFSENIEAITSFILGDGDLHINNTRNYAVGIGSGYNDPYGTIHIETKGTVSLRSSGEKILCIGGGWSAGEGISVVGGKLDLVGNGVSVVCLGSYVGAANISVCGADVKFHADGNEVLLVGSNSGDAKIVMEKSSVDLSASCEVLAAFGTMSGSVGAELTECTVKSNTHCDKGSVFGSFDGEGSIVFRDSNVRLYGEGYRVSGFGSLNGKCVTRVESGEIDGSLLAVEVLLLGNEDSPIVVTGGNIHFAQESNHTPISPAGTPLCFANPRQDHYEAVFRDGDEEWTYRADRNENGYLGVWILL